MVKKISGYFNLSTLNESKHKKGFVTNGSRRKTRQGTQAALMGMSATVGSGSTAYDAFRKENQDENGEDEFKIDLNESGKESQVKSDKKPITKLVNKMVCNLSGPVNEGQTSDPESSGIQNYGSSAGSFVQSALGKDSDQDSGRLSIPDSLSQCSFTDMISVWDTSIISLSPATSHFNIHTDVINTATSVPSEVMKATKLGPEKSVPKKEKLKLKVKSIKDRLIGGSSKPTPESFNETVLSIPPDKTVLQWVTEVLTPLADEEEKGQHLADESLQGSRPPNYGVSLYIECLQRCLESGVFPASSIDLSSAALLEKNKHLMDGIDPISYVLRKLKIDLHQAPDSYVVDFLAQPNNGMNLLVHLLREILHAEEALTGTTTIQANRKAKHDQYRRNLNDEHDCLLCIKFSLRVKAAIRELLNVPYGLETVAQCLISCFSRARLTALEILTECLFEPSGLNHVLDAFTFVRLKFGEPQRFKMLISILNSAGSRRLSFQTVCMRFLNNMLNATSSLNSRVFLQHQLLLAGLDIDALEKKSEGDSWERTQLQHEVNEWKAKYIDVENLQEEQIAAQNRNALLRQEVDLLQDKMKAVETEYELTRKGTLEANKKTEDYQERVFELQEKMEKLMILYEEKTGQLAEKNLSLGDVMRSVEIPEFNSERRDSCASMASSTSSHIPAPPPIPPSRYDPKISEIKKKVEPKVDLPTLNWVPLTNIRRTVFEELNDDIIYEELDFADFESKFQVQKRDRISSSSKSTKSLAKSEKRLKTLNNNRARNIVITLRRIGHSAREIRDYINLYDTDSLLGEYAELLLKFVPTKDETKTLTRYSEDYANLDESEQLMYQLAQIERTENKLKVMAFMGQFDDIIEYLNPQIQRITASSKSLCENKKVQKVFEIILAFGNYMNSSKRGFIGGFKLESLQKLSEIKSKDRSETLLEYLVNIIIWYYPHLMAWFDDLNLDLPKSASYQSIAADIFSLRKGIDLVKFEREKNNALNENLEFYSQASTELHVVWESFKEMEEWYKQACSMFGENYKSIDPGLFVSYFSDFAFQFKISLKKCLQSGEEFPVMLMSSPRTMSVNTLYHEPISEKMGLLRKVNTLQHSKNSLRRSYTKFKRSSSPGSSNASKRYIRSSDRQREQARLLSDKEVQSIISGSSSSITTLPLRCTNKEIIPQQQQQQQQQQQTESAIPTSQECNEVTSDWTRLTFSSPCLLVTPPPYQEDNDDEGAYDEVVDAETFNLSMAISSSSSSRTSSSMNRGDSNPITDSDEDSGQLIMADFQLIAEQLTFTQFTANQLLRIETEDEVTFL